MITELTGVIKFSDARSAFIVIEAHGVGYEVFVSSSTRALLPFANSPDTVTLKIKTVASENSITLFGFATMAEYGAFILLIRVPRVGPRVAQKLLSLNLIHLFDAIVKGDAEKLLTVKGVGKVTVNRILHELNEKAAAYLLTLKANSGLSASINQPVVLPGEHKKKHPAETARLEDLFRARHKGGGSVPPSSVPAQVVVDELEEALGGVE